MERLTIDEIIAHCKRQIQRYDDRYGAEYFETASIEEYTTKEYWEHKQVAAYLEELKEYRIAEDAGLFFRLPCKEGDTVHAIVKAYDCPYGYSQERCPMGGYVDCDSCPYEAEKLSVEKIGFDYRMMKQFGLTVFQTQEQAEQALQKMGGKV